MNLRTYDYECATCGLVFEGTVDYEIRDAQRCLACESHLTRLMSSPAIHTLETHFRGYRGGDNRDRSGDFGGAGKWVPAHGEFVDENLCDPVTRAPIRYSTLKGKETAMAKAGVYQKGPVKQTRFYGNVGSHRR